MTSQILLRCTEEETKSPLELEGGGKPTSQEGIKGVTIQQAIPSPSLTSAASVIPLHGKSLDILRTFHKVICITSSFEVKAAEGILLGTKIKTS